MERKKIMTWMLTWLNVSAAALNATFYFLVIYRFVNFCSNLVYIIDQGYLLVIIYNYGSNISKEVNHFILHYTLKEVGFYTILVC